MPLKSKHFKGISRFEFCLVSDPSHVVPGERGPHVGKIQEALTILGAGIISADQFLRNDDRGGRPRVQGTAPKHSEYRPSSAGARQYRRQEDHSGVRPGDV